MHPYLTRLGIGEQVQSFFRPFYHTDHSGNLVFDYGNEMEHFGFAFHRVPATEEVWIAGNKNFRTIRRVLICSCAMDAIAYLHYNSKRFTEFDNLLFVSLGVKPNPEQFRWIQANLSSREFTLLFGNDILGTLCDLKTATGIRRLPLSITHDGYFFTMQFRARQFKLDTEELSLSRFEYISGCRFRMKTAKPAVYLSWFARLKEEAFNVNT